MSEETTQPILIEWNGQSFSIPYSTYIQILMEYSLNPFAHESEETEMKIKSLLSPFVEEKN